METVSRRRSVVLSKDELKALKRFRKSFNTEVECAEAIGIHKVVLGMVLKRGSGAPETVARIRHTLSALNSIDNTQHRA